MADLQRIADLIMQKKALENDVRDPLGTPYDEEERFNLYTILQDLKMNQDAPEDTYDNNIYSILGLK